MAKTAKKTATKVATKTATKVASKKVEAPVASTMLGGRKVRQLLASAPHYKFTEKGQELECIVKSKIIPTEGEFEGKLIGWNVVDLSTGELVMVGSTHQIEKAFTMNENGKELWETGAKFLITWNGKSNLGNGKTFNNFDISLIEE